MDLRNAVLQLLATIYSLSPVWMAHQRFAFCHRAPMWSAILHALIVVVVLPSQRVRLHLVCLRGDICPDMRTAGELVRGQRACGNSGSTRRPHGRLRAQSASAAESSRRREVKESTSGWEQLFIGDGVKNCDAIPSSLPSNSLPASRRRRNGGNGQNWRSLRRNSVGSRPVADNLTAPIRANVLRDQHNLHTDIGALDTSNARRRC